jgi:ABC-2 type transport system ATP-binding protein/lipopolysaccharide transport system ATP-binding protein
MSDCRVKLQNVCLNIPVSTPGRDRLFKRPSFLPSVGGALSQENGKLYVYALKNLSLELTEGQSLGLIGHNGAGKTSLLRLIAGIYPATTGTVETQGSIGTVLEGGANVSTDMTGRECIRYFTLIYGHTQDHAEVERDVSSFADLGDFLDLPMRTYSAGMHSRLKAALATAWNQDIMLIDEGIDAGDMAFKEKFTARLNAYLRRASILVLASHSLETLRTYCKLGMVLSHGEVIFYGAIDGAIEYYVKSQQRAASSS